MRTKILSYSSGCYRTAYRCLFVCCLPVEPWFWMFQWKSSCTCHSAGTWCCAWIIGLFRSWRAPLRVWVEGRVLGEVLFIEDCASFEFLFECSNFWPLKGLFGLFPLRCELFLAYAGQLGWLLTDHERVKLVRGMVIVVPACLEFGRL